MNDVLLRNLPSFCSVELWCAAILQHLLCKSTCCITHFPFKARYFKEPTNSHLIVTCYRATKCKLGVGKSSNKLSKIHELQVGERSHELQKIRKLRAVIWQNLSRVEFGRSNLRVVDFSHELLKIYELRVVEQRNKKSGNVCITW